MLWVAESVSAHRGKDGCSSARPGAYSRQIVGWSMATNMGSMLVMARCRTGARSPAPRAWADPVRFAVVVGFTGSNVGHRPRPGAPPGCGGRARISRAGGSDDRRDRDAVG